MVRQCEHCPLALNISDPRPGLTFKARVGQWRLPTVKDRPRTADREPVKRNVAQPGSATSSRARHRAPEPDDVDELTDTVATSPLCLAYVQDAASTTACRDLWPATVFRAVPLVDDASVAEPDVDDAAPGQRTATGRIAHMPAGRLRP